ncbi:MAG TPA: Crp/Fnr family transcriptional regulator [Acidobacteriota bacterium]|jgi:CRP/FNR family transcriptional regulator|nr:Crp/Fnr family transcriptional regulator [Acidobacteriota bacterium]
MISKVAALQGTELFRSVAPETLRSLAERAEFRKLPAGEFLFSAGEPCRGLFVVVEGWTRALRHGADGREQVIHEDGPGSTFPEVAVFDDGPYPSTVVATHDSTLLFLRKEDVKRFCLAHPEVALAALKILSRRLRRATGMIERFALLEVAQRVAGYVIQQIPPDQPVAGCVEFELPHTNQDIADRVGTVREVVSRAFASFQRKGWLEKEHRRIRIKDVQALKRYAAGEE